MALSPMFAHYLSQKEVYKDCILLYRMGDFYEMYGEDAVIVSSALGLTLTSRSNGEERISMCGVPYHAVDNYVAKLVRCGHKVAICEQIAQPKKNIAAEEECAGKGAQANSGKSNAKTKEKTIKREVVQVVTKGTTLREEIIEQGRPNCLASVFATESNIGLALCDVSNGEVLSYQFDGTDCVSRLESTLVSFIPSEIICDTKSLFLNSALTSVESKVLPIFTPYLDWYFDVKRAEKKIIEHCPEIDVVKLGLKNKPYTLRAVGGLLYYVTYANKCNKISFSCSKPSSFGENMLIDADTRLSLLLTTDKENENTLFGLLNQTLTGGGSRELANWFALPLQNVAQINARYDGVSALLNADTSILRSALSQIGDIRRISSKITSNYAKPKDYWELKVSLAQIDNVKSFLSKFSADILREVSVGLCDYEEISSILDCITFSEEGVEISKGSFAQYDAVKESLREYYRLLFAYENSQKDRLRVKNLKVGENKVFGYYIEVPNSASVPIDYLPRQSTSNAQRYVTEELRQLEYDISTAKEKMILYESTFFEELQGKISAFSDVLHRIGKNISVLDCLLAFAVVSKKNHYVRPSITKGGELQIINGRHPIMEQRKSDFVPNDCELSAQKCCMVITGPNMAGKSTYMRQVALICFMAHIGCFVPSQSAEIPLIDKIFTRVGAFDDILFDKSTFMVEILQVVNIVNNATINSLVILDEVGRGTSSIDGESIATAITEYLASKTHCKTLFATHFHNISALENSISTVFNRHVNVSRAENGKVTFLYKLVRGSCNSSFGIEVAKSAGLRQEIVERAEEISALLQKNKQ